jgi:hypothetical protein
MTPFFACSLASEGEKLIREGDRQAAVDCFLEALKLGSANMQVLSVVNSQLGTCYFNMVCMLWRNISDYLLK